jgi:hypothetical protein
MMDYPRKILAYILIQMRGSLIPVNNGKKRRMLGIVSIKNKSAGQKRGLMDVILKGTIRNAMKCHMF